MSVGLDTNVLLRHTLDDDARQSPAASVLISGAAPGAAPLIVNAVVLIEYVWTLGRREGFAKPRILEALEVLAASDRIVFAEDRCVRDAIAAWRTGRADFADYLIGALNRSAGASTTMTFDAAAAEHPDFTLIR